MAGQSGQLQESAAAQDTRTADPWSQLEDEARAAQQRGDGQLAADKWLQLAALAHRSGYYSDGRFYAAKAGVFDYEGPPPPERECNTCGDTDCRGHCDCGLSMELRGDALVCPDDRCEQTAALRQARALYRRLRQEGEPATEVAIWRKARWTALADLYRGRGNERGVARCVAHLREAA